MSYGHIYCLSNPIHPGIYYVNYTRSNPLEVLEQMNMSESNVFDYSMEFSKYINNHETKGEIIEHLLNVYGACINPERNFYQINKSVIQNLFALVEGEWFDI